MPPKKRGRPRKSTGDKALDATISQANPRDSTISATIPPHEALLNDGPPPTQVSFEEAFSSSTPASPDSQFKKILSPEFTAWQSLNQILSEEQTTSSEDRPLQVRLRVPEGFRPRVAIGRESSALSSKKVDGGLHFNGNDAVAREFQTPTEGSLADLESLAGSTGSNMAPVGSREADRFKDNEIDIALKETIQELFEIQAATLGYVPETQVELVNKIENLTLSLQTLRTLTTDSTSSTSASEQPLITPSLPLIPPEIIQYVDEGRNPDIYNREFVESIIRYNQNINGKRKAFSDFSEIFAQKLMKGVPGVEKEAERIMEAKRNAEREQDQDREGV